MDEVRGELWPMDRFGRVLNAGDRDAMTPLARRVARAVADAYRARLGDALHSVYLTGAAARGLPGPLEAFGVLRVTATTFGPSWLEEAAGGIRARWPGAGRPLLSVYEWKDMFPDGDAFSRARFRLGVNSVCLAGRDLARTIPPQRLSVAAANGWIVDAQTRLDAISERVSLVTNEEDIKREARAAARFLLTASYALVMHHEGVYTEDPDLQRAFIALNFPAKADELLVALELATVSTSSAVDLLALLQGYGRWLAAECDRWLDKHNPQRIKALPA